MFLNARNYKFYIDDTYIDYITFGKGEKWLLLIRGLSTFRIGGMALPVAYMYRMFAKEYRVCIIDRRVKLPVNYTIEQMAEDTFIVAKSIGVENADVVGVSQGGMIAQCLAINHPDFVNRMALVVTACRPNDTIDFVLNKWIEMVAGEKYSDFTADMMYRMYSDKYISKYKAAIPLLSHLQKSIDADRFITQSKAILDFDMYDRLNKISCPVFVVAGRQDKVTTATASEEIAEKLNCKIHIYENYGHALYEEAKDFNKRIMNFLIEK